MDQIVDVNSDVGEFKWVSQNGSGTNIGYTDSIGGQFSSQLDDVANYIDGQSNLNLYRTTGGQADIVFIADDSKGYSFVDTSGAQSGTSPVIVHMDLDNKSGDTEIGILAGLENALGLGDGSQSGGDSALLSPSQITIINNFYGPPQKQNQPPQGPPPDPGKLGPGQQQGNGNFGQGQQGQNGQQGNGNFGQGQQGQQQGGGNSGQGGQGQGQPQNPSWFGQGQSSSGNSGPNDPGGRFSLNPQNFSSFGQGGQGGDSKDLFSPKGQLAAS